MWSWLSNPQLWSSLAQVGGTIAANRAKGRADEATIGLSRDRNNTDLYGVQQNAALKAAELAHQADLDAANLDLKRKGFALEAPKARANLAVLGDIMANAQDVRVDHPRANVVHFAGGLRPSLLSGETRDMGTQMRKDAILKQLAGDSFQDVPTPNYQGTLKTPPTPTPMPQANGLDSTLSWLSILSAIAQAYPRRQGSSPAPGPGITSPKVWNNVRF